MAETDELECTCMADEHECPYDAEILDIHDLCTCCPCCQAQCEMEI